MKVGRITLLTAFLLALPVAAWAGVDPCEFLGGDTDFDTVCDATDNCVTIPNTSQTDTDGDLDGDACDNCIPVANADQADGDTDGRGNVCDNCVAKQNGPLAYAAGLSAVSQCDTNSDGYGNACDGDFTNDGFKSSPDLALYKPAPFSPGGVYDLNCDGFKSSPDLAIYKLLPFSMAGVSGWACAGFPPCGPLP